MPNDPMDNEAALGRRRSGSGYVQYGSMHYGQVEGVAASQPYVHPQEVADLREQLALAEDSLANRRVRGLREALNVEREAVHYWMGQHSAAQMEIERLIEAHKGEVAHLLEQMGSLAERKRDEVADLLEHGESTEEFQVTSERVKPHSLCCTQCAETRGDAARLRELTAVVVDAWTLWIDTRKPEWAYEPEDPATETLDAAIGKLGRVAVPDRYDA